MRMLLVEDDDRLRSQLADHFAKLNWVVDQAPNGREAEFFAQELEHDIAIVDLGLPDISGVELVTRWRQRAAKLPILILTARADWQDKVNGLEAGADDYVTKPFYLEELAARVNALLRRAEGRSTDEVKFGPIVVNFSAQKVFKNDDELPLTNFEFRLLASLARKPGEVVSRVALMDQLYEHDQDRDPNGIEVLMGRLRKKLSAGEAINLIETVRGAGYRLSPP